MSYEESYLGQLRAVVGSRRLIVVTTRAVIRDPERRILFVRRSDNSDWVMPSGSMELDETVYECKAREVKEETGRDVLEARPIGIYSTLNNVTSYDDPFDQVSVQFLVSEWSGSIERTTDETTDARFFPVDQPPEAIDDRYKGILSDLRLYLEPGEFILRESRSS